MNTENILKLADIVERQEYSETLLSIGFNMSSYWHPCGTPSCIAGFASAQSGGTKSDGSTFSRAMKWLDINQDVARALFIPKGQFPVLANITPAMAAWTLRNLAKMGHVVWRQS